MPTTKPRGKLPTSTTFRDAYNTGLPKPRFCRKGDSVACTHRWHSQDSPVSLLYCLSPFHYLHSPCWVLPKPQDLPIELSPAGAVVFLLLAAPGLTLKPLVCLCHIIAFRQAGSFLTTIWERCCGQHTCRMHLQQTKAYISFTGFSVQHLVICKKHHHLQLFVSLGAAITKVETSTEKSIFSVLVILPIDLKKILLDHKNLISNPRVM